jgi:hypothetical protein
MTHDAAPPPSRIRPTWPELPVEVRADLEERIGGTVLGWTSHDGGYSPGLASTLRTTQGPLFVKAVSAEHEVAADLYREEARRAALLPADVPTPRLLWWAEVGAGQGGSGGTGAAGRARPAAPGGPREGAREWVAVAFEAVPGSRTPRTPWDDAELDAVLRLCSEVASFEVEPGRLPEFADTLPGGRTAALADERPRALGTFDPWYAANLERLAAAERDAPAAVTGSALVHADLRGDNSLLVGGPRAVRALAVDWPNASRGAAFCDLVGMLPATRLEGGPPPEEAQRRRPHPPRTDGDAVST